MMLPSAVRQILPVRIEEAFAAAARSTGDVMVETIRLRRDKPLSVTAGGREWFLAAQGRLEREPRAGLCPTKDEIEALLSAATQGSLYAVEGEIRRGYLTLAGGHRLGLAGEAVVSASEVVNLKHISAVHIRIAHEIKGCADRLVPHVYRDGQRPFHTLVVGPPGSGKTTLLRDLVRQLSDGDARANRPGLHCVVADERSEIAGTYRGQAQLDVGQRTDVIDGAAKAAAMAMAVRSLAPDVIATDEIGAAEDVPAALDVLRCGVTLIASAHAADLDDLVSRPVLRELVQAGAFERIVMLSKRCGVGTVEEVVSLLPASRTKVTGERGSSKGIEGGLRARAVSLPARPPGALGEVHV